jgi:hypothetical protein
VRKPMAICREAVELAGKAWEGSVCRPYSVATGACLLATEIVARASPMLPRSTERAEAALSVQTEALIFQ